MHRIGVEIEVSARSEMHRITIETILNLISVKKPLATLNVLCTSSVEDSGSWEYIFPSFVLMSLCQSGQISIKH